MAVARLYIRHFRSVADAERLLSSVETHVRDRIAAVSASLTCFQPQDRRIVIELWQYPDADSMEWVRGSLQGVTVIPDTMMPQNTIHTLRRVISHGSEDWETAD